MPLTHVDLKIRKIEDQLCKQIARSERTLEQVLALQYWWKRFSSFLIDRDQGQTRSKHFRATRRWFVLASRYHRRLHEATRFKATQSVIRACEESGFRLRTDHAFWPHRRACNRCLVSVANYVSARDRVDRENLFFRAHRLWQCEPSQAHSLATHVLRAHGDLGNARFCPWCNKLCASEHGVFMHAARNCRSPMNPWNQEHGPGLEVRPAGFRLSR